MKILHFKLLIIIIFLLIICVSCRNQSDHESMPLEDSLLIAAASDLTLAFQEIGELFEEERGVAVTFSFGSTGQLYEQIRNGAPFDIFAAANIQFVDQLHEQGLIIPETQTTYAFGRIGIATKLDSPLAITSIEGLLLPEVKKVAIANPDHAPYGLAAKQALQSAGIWEEISNKLVFGRNISDTLAYIETGNVEAGIIALSLYQEDKIAFHLIEEDWHEPLEQSIAVINTTDQESQAMQFIQFISGPIGRPIMESYGFIVPEGLESDE